MASIVSNIREALSRASRRPLEAHSLDEFIAALEECKATSFTAEVLLKTDFILLRPAFVNGYECRYTGECDNGQTIVYAESSNDVCPLNRNHERDHAAYYLQGITTAADRISRIEAQHLDIATQLISEGKVLDKAAYTKLASQAEGCGISPAGHPL